MGDRTQNPRRGIIQSVSVTLLSSDTSLAAAHDVALLDLDGVVYVGRQAVPGAPEALSRAREAGMRLAFVTNNAARPPQVVAEHLTELAIAAEAAEVITSAQAAARYLAEHLPTGARVLVLGTTGLYEALAEQDLQPTDRWAEGVAAVVQGYSPEMNWALLAEGAVAITNGALWVATNVDPTVPSPRGPLPGNGSLVAAMRLATRAEPVVTGKPDPTMHRETMIRTGAEHPIVVGDRLDTDIEGANAVGCPSLLVFSGVTDVPDLLAAPAALRPTYLGADVGALLDTHTAPVSEPSGARCGPWSVEISGDAIRLSSSGEGATASADETGSSDREAGTNRFRFGADDLDAVRALCAAWWGAGDQDRSAAPTSIVGVGDAAARTLARLDLA